MRRLRALARRSRRTLADAGRRTRRSRLRVAAVAVINGVVLILALALNGTVEYLRRKSAAAKQG